ncbi:carbohydrate ABC transporter permease [Psychromicrobium xiongbiense]|uniref:carbohydrate ABC transporter permease n=1 Tax=Psychromicrobium xiongbiense TaxID=3051184 RepID=UPI0025564F84|nr:sugar ABC transporter permease [Psychromicrobium sp. YIM S02556]
MAVLPASALGRTQAGRAPHRAGLRVPWWFLVPGLAVYIFVVIWPTLQGMGFAFTDWNGLSSHFSFVGFENFTKVLGDKDAISAIQNTLVLAFVVTLFQTLFGLLLALGLNQRLKTRNLLRTIFFMPVVLTPLVAGYVWSYLLAPRGALNSLLDSVGLGVLSHDWLGDPSTALGAICVTIVWQFSGYSMVIFLAGLQAIPDELMEAAIIDGAGPFQRFWRVTFPLLNGSVVIVLLLTMIGSLNQFAQVYVMTKGGPFHATETISTLILKKGFQAGDYPYGTALGVIMAIIVGAFAILQYRLTTRRVTE